MGMMFLKDKLLYRKQESKRGRVDQHRQRTMSGLTANSAFGALVCSWLALSLIVKP
jgi:hypothetical protein